MTKKTFEGLRPMKKVFLLERDPLMFKAWEVRLKDSSWELYALDNKEDFEFRLEEFNPDLVIVSEELSEVLTLVSQIPVAVMTDNQEYQGISLKKPIDLNNLELVLDQLFAQFSN